MHFNNCAFSFDEKNDDFIFICESRDAAFYAFFSIEFHTLIGKKNVK